MKLHRDVISRQNVGHIHLKNVRAMLLEQTSGFPLLFRRFVGLASGLLFFDLRFDATIAHREKQRVDGRAR